MIKGGEHVFAVKTVGVDAIHRGDIVQNVAEGFPETKVVRVRPEIRLKKPQKDAGVIILNEGVAVEVYCPHTKAV